MTDWHDHLSAKILVRMAGVVLLPCTVGLAHLLARHVVTPPSHACTAVEFLIAALLFLCASGAAALLIVGPSLWAPVTLAARWQVQRAPRAGATRQTVLETSSATSNARPSGS